MGCGSVRGSGAWFRSWFRCVVRAAVRAAAVRAVERPARHASLEALRARLERAARLGAPGLLGAELRRLRRRLQPGRRRREPQAPSREEQGGAGAAHCFWALRWPNLRGENCGAYRVLLDTKWQTDRQKYNYENSTGHSRSVN